MSFWDTVMHPKGDEPYRGCLIAATVDAIAQHDPDRVCFSFPRSMNLADGFRDMNFRTFANAINKTAYFIQQEIGRSSMFETVLYMGCPDVRHFIVLVALIKTGHKVLFSCHQNSVAGHAELIKRSDCTILLHTSGFPVSGILEKCRMETLCMPELEYLLDDGVPCDHYPYNHSFDVAKHHPALVIHTSGSAGLPKPVVWTQYSLSAAFTHHKIGPLDGRRTLWGAVFNSTRRTFNALPVVHGIGIATSIRRACYNNSTVVLGPPGLVTADVFDQVLNYGNIDAATCIPLTLEEIATRPDILARLRSLNHVSYVGGLLSKDAGDLIAKHVQLYAIMASTESNTLIQHETDPEDWEYICLNSTYTGIEMRLRGDLYELVFVKSLEHLPFQGVFEVFPRLTEYSMADLYSKHPSKPDHWKHEGRVDDMIVFRNGWNFSPIIHEHFITSHPAVQNCVLVGTGRDVPAAVIELTAESYTEEVDGKEAVLEAIWPKVQEANSYAATTGQLSQEYVIFAKKEKPFKITGKGTVSRKAAIKTYGPEIEELYANAARKG